jgi:hypothetical protein
MTLYINEYFSKIPNNSEISEKKITELINNICLNIYDTKIQLIQEEIEVELKSKNQDQNKIKELRNKQAELREKKRQITTR